MVLNFIVGCAIVPSCSVDDRRAVPKEEAVRRSARTITVLFLCFLAIAVRVQPASQSGSDVVTAETLSGLELRAIGPALMGGLDR